MTNDYESDHNMSKQTLWPDLSLDAWKDTYTALHMWTQIVGKIRLKQTPYVNHWWQVTLYVTARGLTTSPIPFNDRVFEIQFDFIDHCLHISTSDGAVESIVLSSCSVAEFYKEFMSRLKSLKLEIQIWPIPVEVENAVSFEQNQTHLTYDPIYAQNFWQILLHTAQVFQRFRSGFIGKCSPIHFFWGSFDLAMTRFSGRKAPVHPPVPNLKHTVVIEAYSHEVSSCGFWPGGGPINEPVFYAYSYPEPKEYSLYPVRPFHALYFKDMREYILPYNSVRKTSNPDQELLAFLQSTYEAAAITGHWDRVNLERLNQ